MFIIEVIPLVKINARELQLLTYFSSKEPKIGSLVLIPLGKNKAKAIVIKIGPLKEKKIDIKKSNFKLRPISKILSSESIVSSAQVSLALWISNYYLCPIGLALKLFLPKSFLRRKNLTEGKSTISFVQPKELSSNAKPSKPILLWTKERSNFYSKVIEKTIHQNRQVLILVPETKQIKYFYQLAKKISAKTAKIDSRIAPKQELEIWKKISQSEINIIIGTRKALFLPFSNLGLIIVEQEESSNYKSWDQHPRYHTRTVALKLAQLFKIKIILGTSFPSVNSYYWAKQGKFSLKTTPEQHLLKNNVAVVDMKEEIKKGNYSIFSEKLKIQLKTIMERDGQAVLFINRRGSSSTVMCRDCGYVVRCPNCNGAMVFHKQTNNSQLKKEGGVLVCHHCGHKEALPSVCPKCGSWRIKYFGAGTEKVMEELKKENLKALRLDSDIAPTKKKQERIIEDFENKKYNILVGTQLIFHLKNQDIQLVGAILVDTLLSLPEFRSPEKLMRLLCRLTKLGEETIIQTYNSDSYVFKYFKKYDLKGFLEEEIKNRKMFSYPPFSKIIKLSFSHPDPVLAKEKAEKVKKLLEHSISQIKVLGPSPGIVPKIKNKYIWNILLKTKNNALEELYPLKNLLGPNWVIDVEPQSLL